MSWKASGYAKCVTLAPNGEKITRSEKLLLLVIADYYNDSEAMAWPNIRDLARETMMSVRSVQNKQRSLEKKGLLKIEPLKHTNGAVRSNAYSFPGLGGGADSAGGGANSAGGGAESAPGGASHAAPGGANHAAPGGASHAAPPIKEEPIDNLQSHTHNREAGSARAGSRFSFSECRRYAEHLRSSGQGIEKPGGYATVIFRSGEADSQIEEFLNPARAPDVSLCPDCEGRGVYYPLGIGNGGVKKCGHERLRSQSP